MKKKCHLFYPALINDPKKQTPRKKKKTIVVVVDKRTTYLPNLNGFHRCNSQTHLKDRNFMY